MAQFANKVKVPDSGIVRHVVGFGQGDPGYDVVQIGSSVGYYYLKDRAKHSVTVTEQLGRYYVEYNKYNDLDSFLSCQKKSGSLKNVSREYLMETVRAYRAYRIIFGKYKSFRDDILEAANTLECVYLGNMSKDRERLKELLEKSGFHVTSVDFDMIKTKEGICLSTDGLCFNQDEIIP